MNNIPIIIANRIIRFIGNIFKVLSYPFHFLFPSIRFSIPDHSPAKVRNKSKNKITKIIWQTNFSNKSSLPVYLNYLFNRLMSLDYEYRYVSTEERQAYLKNHAPKEIYEAYLKLTDGAAQADLWRVVTLYLEGGVYMDIDATLVWPLKRILQEEDHSLYIKIKNDTEITNYFLATYPNNPDYKDVIDKILHNINHYDPRKGVYGTTGPQAFNDTLKDRKINSRRRRYVCIQGTFTNEYFQYLDKPRGKWTHQDPNDLIKK
ncbi:glycosyltransferase [Vibrio sp. Isolate24]|uniref:glycosyltransferase family 32 protein n=1 Tax=Vibrio sp. Isolate24 TaxID=2908534 RepID=UPI001EFDED8F|nr:glycosyltransferase [Vibrio sp. Isolate24]MCG9679302.1 glycosyl transferase [Vibrio sp. Isolate24]